MKESKIRLQRPLITNSHTGEEWIHVFLDKSRYSSKIVNRLFAKQNHYRDYRILQKSTDTDLFEFFVNLTINSTQTKQVLTLVANIQHIASVYP